MTALAVVDPDFTVEAPSAPPSAKTTYFVVLHTQTGYGKPSAMWERALRLLAALAEESPGYLGYEVKETGNGGEYAVTHWSDPRFIARWKKSCRMLESDQAMLDRIFGKEGCIWPWMSEGGAA